MSGSCCYSVAQLVVYHPQGVNVKDFLEHFLAEYSSNHAEDVKDMFVEYKVIQTNSETQDFSPTENYVHTLEKVPTFIYTAQIDLEQQPE